MNKLLTMLASAFALMVMSLMGSGAAQAGGSCSSGCQEVWRIHTYQTCEPGRVWKCWPAPRTITRCEPQHHVKRIQVCPPGGCGPCANGRCATITQEIPYSTCRKVNVQVPGEQCGWAMGCKPVQKSVRLPHCVGSPTPCAPAAGGGNGGGFGAIAPAPSAGNGGGSCGIGQVVTPTGSCGVASAPAPVNHGASNGIVRAEIPGWLRPVH